MQSFLVLLFLCGLSCVYAKEYTPVKQCGSDKLFKNVAIITKKGVCTKLPCQMKLGEEVVAEIEFTNKQRVEKIVSSCKALVLGNEIIFQIPDADKGCDYLVQGKCPAEPNTDLALRLKVPVKPPSLAKVGIDTQLEVNLTDQKKRVISCFKFTAKVIV